jgi:Transposase domain (DUF772)
MDSFTTWVLRGLNANGGKSRLSQISDFIDWDPFRLILEEMYTNKTERGGRPNCDVILMFKILILQQWYNMSDLEVERQMSDRISFMAFLDFPNPFPDSRTIWLFRERMAETGKDKLVWAELQRQLDLKGLKVRCGIVQDATFIEPDPGSANKSRGNESKTRRSRDGTWAKKGTDIHFGYKLHQITDIDYCLIRDMYSSRSWLKTSCCYKKSIQRWKNAGYYSQEGSCEDGCHRFCFQPLSALYSQEGKGYLRIAEAIEESPENNDKVGILDLVRQVIRLGGDLFLKNSR